jgi:D-3-phosphoglycerate dehydrogenase
MKIYNVLVTFKIMINFIRKNKNKLPKNLNFKLLNIPQALNEKKLKKIIKNYHGLICGDDEVNKEVLNEAKNLKVISKWGTGIDSIDIKECKKKKIKVFNTPGAFTESVAQLAFAFIIIFSRDILKTHLDIKKNNWPKFQGRLLKGQTVGIIGLGKIGSKLAEYANKFKMKIIFVDLEKNNKKYKKVSLNFLMKNSDYICLCCDHNKTSHEMLGFSKFKMAKKNSSLINVARGKLIKEKELINALKKGYFSNVALDVFENEPLNKNNQLRKFKRVILSSHNAFNTAENVSKVNINTLKNLLKVLK